VAQSPPPRPAQPAGPAPRASPAQPAGHPPRAAPAGDGQWTLPGRDLANTRYSPLTEIHAGNARALRPVWTFSTGVLGGHEGQPLVVDDTLYVVTPYPNVLYAFDLKEEGYPLKWRYRPFVRPQAIGTACCDTVNRGASYAAGKIVYNLLDGHTVAIDAASGREVWRRQIADLALGETTPMAPLIARDKVLVGNSGGEFGVRGWIKALDLATGRLLWTGYSTGPDREVLVDPAYYRPHYPADRGPDLAARTWPDAAAWRVGGGPVWGWISYDPALDLIYYGTGNPAPYNAAQRPGDNKWTNSVLARNLTDGRVRWAYQETPADNWDFDATQEHILVDREVAGRIRRLLVHFDKNGYVYTLDRERGEVLRADAYVPVNWARRVDLASGRPEVDPAKTTGAGRVTRDICPNLEGGKNQQPAAYSPRTRLFYVPTGNMCMDYKPVALGYFKGTPYIGAEVPYRAGKGGHLGAFIAWDAWAGKKVWELREPFPAWGGALVTAGDVVFYGTLDGWFKAVDARTGELLWRFKLGSGVVGNPIAYRGPDGKEYIAIYAGIGGDWYLLAGDTRVDDPADVRPAADFMPDLARYTSRGGLVWIFGL
jgi:PQQ-dependent dehydrogenase (methanol/ethanol family)